jgi:hypothetical protein
MKAKAFVVLSIFSLIPTTAAVAGTTGWSYTNYNYGSYVPLRGAFREEVLTSYSEYVTYVDILFDATNVNSIRDYNNGGDNPGADCDGVQAYVTVDTTAVPISDPEFENLNAVHQSSNLPNPKFDIEDDVFTGPQNEESEVVVLGTVLAGYEYYFDTVWEDLRGGFPGYNGNIYVQFAMSSLGWSDYNNCVTAGAVQVINPYSQYRHTL